MKKVCLAWLMILLLVTLCGCNHGYINSYAATIMSTSCKGNEASMKFDSFQGSYHFKLQRESEKDNNLECEAELKKGTMNVYIGTEGEKELLFTLAGGESFEEGLVLQGKYSEADAFYIILESEGACSGGDFEFEID